MDPAELTALGLQRRLASNAAPTAIVHPKGATATFTGDAASSARTRGNARLAMCASTIPGRAPRPVGRARTAAPVTTRFARSRPKYAWSARRTCTATMLRLLAATSIPATAANTDRIRDGANKGHSLMLAACNYERGDRILRCAFPSAACFQYSGTVWSTMRRHRSGKEARCARTISSTARVGMSASFSIRTCTSFGSSIGEPMRLTR